MTFNNYMHVAKLPKPTTPPPPTRPKWQFYKLNLNTTFHKSSLFFHRLEDSDDVQQQLFSDDDEDETDADEQVFDDSHRSIEGYVMT